MKRYSYGERDYAFGQAMLTLRMNIGLTQAGLAEQVGVSRRAVGEWEAGSSYPTAHHLQHLITLAVRASAFPAGREEEEIRALWKAAHQKVLLDEHWLAALLHQTSPPPAAVEVGKSGRAEEGSALPPAAPTDWAKASQSGQRSSSIEPVGSRVPAESGPRVDWGEALDVPSFYGRSGELATLGQWLVQERCRVVSVLGMGGIGKSALVTSAMRQVAESFQVVLFRSLRDAPSCEALLEECLQRLAPHLLDVGAADLERRLNLLLSELREQRVLLVLDNLESVLEAGEVRSHMRSGYEGYARLLQRVAETAHHSCLLLTSREKPAVLRALQGRQTPVRSLRLGGLSPAACEQLLVGHELLGSPEERARLVERYDGNPLALHIVAETIADLFGGQIASFFAQDTLVFGSISDLLDEQWGRLSTLEQTILYWLATLRQPVTLEELRTWLVPSLSSGEVLEAVDGLHRRSLVERGQRPGSFPLQSVVLEYVSERLVEQLASELVQESLSLFIQHRLCQAQAKDYVRQTQERLLVAPLLARLQSSAPGHIEVEQHVRSLLEEVRRWPEDRQGYGPANLVTLLRLVRGHLRGLDLSRLVLRDASLQGVQMQDASLSGALLQECVWTESFDANFAVAISRSGQYWAAAGRRGEVRVWRGAGQSLQRVWQAHTQIVWSLTFSPDERTLASGSSDGSLKLWDVESGLLRWSGWQSSAIASLAVAPDGQRIASGGNDATIRLWDTTTGATVETLAAQGAVTALAWSPDGRLLVSGGVEGVIRLWDLQQQPTATCVQTLSGHTHWLFGLAFAPGGDQLASASWDRTVKLWEVESRRCVHTFEGHTDRLYTVAWSLDGRTIASAGFDHTIWLWDAQGHTARVVLRGHRGVIHGLAFTPESHLLLSGSEDGTLRVWDVQRGQCVRVLEGYAAALYDVAWSPDGQRLASAGTDKQVTLWEVAAETLPRVLQGHRWVVNGWTGVLMGSFWRAAGGTIRCGSGTRPRAPVRRSYRIPTVPIPSSMEWRGVPMGSFWPVGAFGMGCRSGRCPQASAAG